MPEFFHGVEVVEVNEALRTLETPSTSVIGLIGTDESAQEDHVPFHTPLLLTGDKREILSKLSLGSTLYESLLAIEEQTCASIVMIRVPQGQTEEETQQNLTGGLEGYTGLQAVLAYEGGGELPSLPHATISMAPCLHQALSAVHGRSSGGLELEGLQVDRATIQEHQALFLK